MSHSKCGVKRVLREVDVLVKDIMDKRNMLLHQFRGNGSLTYDQTRRLLNIYTDEILDGSGPANFLHIVSNCVVGHDTGQRRNDKKKEDLRFKVAELELTLANEKKRLEQSQNQCSKVMISFKENQDKHEKQINNYERTVNDLKLKNKRLLDWVKYLESKIEKFNKDPLIPPKHKCIEREVAYEVLEEKAKSSKLSVNLGERVQTSSSSNYDEPLAKRTRIIKEEKRTVLKKDTKTPTRFVRTEPTVCGDCGYSNKHRNHMTKHTNACKRKTPEFQCLQCKTMYLTIGGFRLHAKSKHGLVGSESKSLLGITRTETSLEHSNEASVGTDQYSNFENSDTKNETSSGQQQLVPQLNQPFRQNLTASRVFVAPPIQSMASLPFIINQQQNRVLAQRPIALSIHSLATIIGIAQELSIALANTTGTSWLELATFLSSLSTGSMNLTNVPTAQEGQLVDGSERSDGGLGNGTNEASLVPITGSTSGRAKGDDNLTITELN